jgi:hypothetical protein
MYHYSATAVDLPDDTFDFNSGESDLGRASAGAGAGRCTPVRIERTQVDSAAVNVHGYYKDTKSASGGSASLIPNEIPSSTTLYVLTTSEGRDKMFKLLQYVLKLGVCFLDYLPLPSSAVLEWATRLSGNIQTVRNGRAMFRVGRWIITMFHVQTILQRLQQKRQAAAEGFHRPSTNAIRLQADMSRDRVEGGASRKGDRDKRHVTWEPETAGPAQPAIPSAQQALPSQNKHSALDFPWSGMLVMLVRCCASIFRNLIRDVLFLASKDLIPKLFFDPAVTERLLSHSNKAWFVVSVADLALNSWRLLDAGWLQYAKGKGVCNCANRPSRYVRNAPSRRDELFFPPLDMDFGSVVPTTAKFYEAASAATMLPSCSRCHSLVVDSPQSEEAALQAVSEEGSSGVVAAVSNSKLFVPWLIRSIFDVTWVVSAHENLFFTLMLQVRYLCDVFLSYRYALGDLQPTMAGLEDEDHRDVQRAMQNHRHLFAATAGATSAFVALLRVVKQAR